MLDDDQLDLDESFQTLVNTSTNENQEPLLIGVKKRKREMVERDINELETLLSEKMVFQQAGVPSNIIWENKSNSEWKLMLRYIACATFVSVMTFFAFSTIVKLKIESSELASKYVSIDCEMFGELNNPID